MKKLMFMLLLAGSIQAMYAQKFSPNTPLFEELTDVKKKTDKFNLYLNMQGSFDAHFQNGFQEGDFNMHQLRIEAKYQQLAFLPLPPASQPLERRKQYDRQPPDLHRLGRHRYQAQR